MKVNARTQAERSAATRAALVASGRKLFAAKGFSGVSTQEIADDAGVTRGALYHQFADKTDVFRAVYEQVEAEVMDRLARQIADSGVTDPVEVLRAGMLAWMAMCAEPEVQQITLVDAPAVLGWREWRELCQRFGLGVLEAMVGEAMAAGRIATQPLRPLAQILFAAADEGALYIAAADDQARAQEEIAEVGFRLLEGLTIND